MGHKAITQEWLGRLLPSWCVVKDHVSKHIPQVMDGGAFANAHVQTCGGTPVFGVSGMAGRTALKFGVSC